MLSSVENLKLNNILFKIPGASWGTTGPKLGLFVLILNAFFCTDSYIAMKISKFERKNV